MKPELYLKKITDLRIKQFGFDTHARVLGIDKEEVKRLWNTVTNNSFKRFPRTEYTMRDLPEFSNRARTYWKLEAPADLLFYVTPTAPIVVPVGLITDKGSIPWFLRGLIAHDDREMILAYLVHDVECEMNRMTRFNTDGLLYEIGTELEAGWLKKNMIYSAVRAAAWLPGKDRIRGGFNISAYNRDLIRSADIKFLESQKYKHHLSIVDSLRATM
jgi:hypothetical protein